MNVLLARLTSAEWQRLVLGLILTAALVSLPMARRVSAEPPDLSSSASLQAVSREQTVEAEQKDDDGQKKDEQEQEEDEQEQEEEEKEAEKQGGEQQKKESAGEESEPEQAEAEGTAKAESAEKQEPAEKPAEASQAAKEEKSPAKTEEKPAPAVRATKPTPSATAVSQPPKHKVKRELFKIEKTFTATFQPKVVGEVRLHSKTWSSFQVKETVSHGQAVKKGDVLIRFDSEEIDRAIADQERAVKSAEMALQEAERTLPLTEKTVPFDLATRERNLQITKEDAERYFSKERDLLIRSYEMNLRSSQMSLESAQEELRQLEKMYKADDLVEETEEFILKRQRYAVERAQFMLELDKDRYERFHKYGLARQDEATKRDLERTTYLTERMRIELPLLLQQQRLSLEQTRTDLERARDRLAKLKADRELMTISAPADGIVFYGDLTRGEWSGASSLQSKLRPGGSVTKGDTIMTLVELPPQTVKFSVEEGDLRWIEVGLEGKFKPAAFPQMSLAANVTKMDTIPIAAKRFEVLAEVTLPKKPLPLTPTMTGNLRFNVYVREDAVVVPAKAIFSEELDPDSQYVYVVRKDGDGYEKRPVRVGERAGDKCEVLSGLREGEEILLEKPDKETESATQKDASESSDQK